MKLILTHGYFLNEDETEKVIMRPYPPLGLLYVSAYLEKQGVNHDVFDSTFSSEEDWYENILAVKPDVIAIYANLMTKVKILHLVKRIKSESRLLNTKILMGGPDLTFNWENYLKHGADFLVIGEGEESMLAFCEQHQGEKDYSLVDGLCYKNERGEFIKNDVRTKIKAVDEIPLPNRKKIDLSKYLDTWKKHHGQGTLNISTQRGCPYTCEWCSTAVYGQSYRRRSPKIVVDEIEHLIQEYASDALWFVDDVFTISHKWLAAFSEEMKAREIKNSF